MIKIDFLSERKYRFDFDEERLSKKIARKVFEIEKCPYDFSFNVILVSDKKIKSINKKERGINKSTDVLSFPNISFVRPANFSKYKRYSKNEKFMIKFRESRLVYFDISICDIESKTIFLGDIVISYDTLIKQAKLYNHSIKREYSFLLTHSLLHLLGYDHILMKDEKIMFRKQDIILSELKINR